MNGINKEQVIMIEKSFQIKLNNGGNVKIDIQACSSGNGVAIYCNFTAPDGSASTTITCTCWDASGESYSTSKVCPSGADSTCDCGVPERPKVACGDPLAFTF
jgi:hypothetical protein